MVVFRLSEQNYGVDIFRVSEIIRAKEITRVPRTPQHILGLVNLRGKTIPVVDLRKRFGLPSVDRSGANRIIVVEAGGGQVGMLVDAVSEVLMIRGECIESAPALVADTDERFVDAIAQAGGMFITLLDLDRALVA